MGMSEVYIETIENIRKEIKESLKIALLNANAFEIRFKYPTRLEILDDQFNPVIEGINLNGNALIGDEYQDGNMPWDGLTTDQLIYMLGEIEGGRFTIEEDYE